MDTVISVLVGNDVKTTIRYYSSEETLEKLIAAYLLYRHEEHLAFEVVVTNRKPSKVVLTWNNIISHALSKKEAIQDLTDWFEEIDAKIHEYLLNNGSLEERARYKIQWFETLIKGTKGAQRKEYKAKQTKLINKLDEWDWCVKALEEAGVALKEAIGA